MPDARSPDELVDAVVALQARLDDLESTLTVRVAGRPTGTVEPTFESTARAGTLFLNGATVARATYPVLFQWATDRSLFIAGLFGVGDGSTTFVLPNMAGRSIIGVGTLAPNTYVLGATGGAASVTLATNQMPAHDHNVTITGNGSHNHPRNGGNFFTNTTGSHGGHNDLSGTQPPGSGFPYGVNSAGSHSHTVDPGDFNTHSHSIGETTIGGTTAVDLRHPYIALNYLIYV